MTQPVVIYPTDFSEPCLFALKFAVHQAKALQAKLLIVHVRDFSAAAGEGMLYAGIPISDADAMKRKLQAVTPQNFDGPYEHHLLTGEPVEELVRFAKEQNAELIVLGTHGRTGIMRALMGSVAEQIIRKAPCPVLAVKWDGKKSA